MTQFLLIAAFAFYLTGESGILYARDFTHRYVLPDTPVNALFRIYEDDDFINIRGKGTDDAYTNGTRLDYFYMPRKRPDWFVDNAIPRAGDSSVDVYGWGLMQLMYTPDDLTSTAYQPNDYPWSGALIATRTVYSYNPTQKYDFQTELVMGILGPAALTKETQTIVHILIHYIRPMGWSHQFDDYPMLNVNFTAEKQQANDRSGKSSNPDTPPEPYHPIENIVWCTNYGAVVTSGDFSISFTQNSSSAMMKCLYSHEVGNISLYFGWK